MPRRTLLAALLSALLLLPGCGAMLRVAPRATTLPPEGLTLASRQCARHFLVDATINGRGPYTLLVDTGAATTILTPRVAAEMPDRAGPTLFGALGAGGKTVVITRRVHIDALEVAGAKGSSTLILNDFDAPVFDLSSFETALGGKLDGILGYPAFRDLLLTLDYPAGALRISREVLQPGPGTIRLLDRDAPRVEFTIQGRPMKATLDSGSGGWFMLKPPGAAATFDYDSPLAPIGSFIAVGGRELSRAGRLRGTATLGPIEIDGPIMEPSRSASLIGTRVMQNASIDFDQRARLVRFRPAPDAPARPDGIFGIGVATLPEHGQVRITDVFPGLPAERAGLKPGDIIDEVNGLHPLDLICERDRLFEHEGSAELRITRDGSPIRVLVDVVALVP